MSNYGNTIFHSVDGGVIIHEPRTETVFNDFDDTTATTNNFSQNYLVLFLILYLLNPPKSALSQLSDTAKTENT